MANKIDFKMARAYPEQIDTMRKWFAEIEAIIEDEGKDTHDLGDFIQRTFESQRIDEYERILFGYETMFEHACDSTLSYLDWKPEIKALMQAAELVADGAHPIHEWFELTYAQYLTVPRLVMDSMPVQWQGQMARLLREMDATFDWRPKQGRYWVRLRDEAGRFCDAPLHDYRHGNIEHLRKK